MKLAASGETFHETASATTPIATGSGRQRRSVKTSTASGMAMKRSRSMFPPSSEGTMYEPIIAAR